MSKVCPAYLSAFVYMSLILFMTARAGVYFVVGHCGATNIASVAIEPYGCYTVA